MMGQAFWIPAHCQGSYYLPVPLDTVSDIIFYFEVLAIAGVFDNLHTSAMNSSKIIMYTDSMNTVNTFNTMHCLPKFNPLLHHCMDIFLEKKFDICVLHIPGMDNVVADMISCHNFDKASKLVPEL